MAEAIFLRALLDEKYCPKYWSYLTESKGFLTRTCSDIAKVLMTTFGENAPSGPAIGWLGQIEDEETRQVFANLDFDLRVQELNDTYVEDAVQFIRDQSAARELNLEKEAIAEDDDQALHDYLKKLRNQKGVDE